MATAFQFTAFQHGAFQIVDGSGAHKFIDKEIKPKPLKIEVALPITGFVLNMKSNSLHAEGKINEDDELIQILMNI